MSAKTMEPLWNIFKTIRNIIFLLFVACGHIGLTAFYVWKKFVDFVVLKICTDYSIMGVMDYLCLIGMDPDIHQPYSKNMNANLGISCVLEGQVDPSKFFDNFVTSVVNTDINSPSDMNLKHPHIRFYQNVRSLGGYWYFKTVVKEFKLEDQVTCMTLQSDSQLSAQQEVCKWLSIQYKDNVPLWGILLIFRESTHDTLFALKVHHVLVDGYSLLHILDLLTNTRYKYTVKDFSDTLWQKAKILTECVYNNFAYNAKMISVPKSPFAKREENEIFLSCVSLPLSSIKEIHEKFGVRFQSVMFHLVRHYIQHTFFEILEEKDIPDQIGITNSLPWPKHPRSVLCNHLTGAAFRFKDISNSEKPCKEILRETNEMFENYHTQHLDKASHLLSQSFIVVPRMFLNLKLLEKPTLDRLSAAYTHLIGSEEYSQVFGTKCSDVHLFCVPPRQKGVTVVCLTTSKEVRISIMGPKWIFPSQEKADKFSHECFQRAITELYANITESHIYK